MTLAEIEQKIDAHKGDSRHERWQVASDLNQELKTLAIAEGMTGNGNDITPELRRVRTRVYVELAGIAPELIR